MPAEDMPAEDMEDLDPGFARQRTELAWGRTALAFAGLGALTLKTVPAAGMLILAIAVVVRIIGRVARPYGPVRAHARGRLLMAVTAAIVLVSVIALVATFLGGDNTPVASTG